MSNTQLTTKTGGRPSALAAMAARIQVDPAKLLTTLKSTVFKGSNDSELLALVVTANEYELNPLLRELYAFPKKGGGIVPMVSIDGWLKIINRQQNFDGMSVEVTPDEGEPVKATCRIFLKDRSHPVEITEYFAECKRGTDPWKTMPRRMLRHKAIIQAGRVAFGISGIRDEDEARDAANMRDVTPVEVDIQPETVNAPQRNPFLESQEPPKRAGEPEAEKYADPKKFDEKPETRRIRCYVESLTKKTGGDGTKRPWVMWKLGYSVEGAISEAATFSKTIGAKLEDLREGDEIGLEIKDGARGPVIASVEKIDGEGDELL